MCGHADRHAELIDGTAARRGG